MTLKKHSFTLIEMLIVIVIIGVLAAALVPRLISVQGRARDSKRKVDLRTIATALSLYESDNGRYPAAQNSIQASDYSTTWGARRIQGITGYVTSIPVDPINACNWTQSWYSTCLLSYTGWMCNCNFLYGANAYRYGNVQTWPNNYDLNANLENQSDPERCETKHWKNSAGNDCRIWSWYSQTAWKYRYWFSPIYQQ